VVDGVVVTKDLEVLMVVGVLQIVPVLLDLVVEVVNCIMEAPMAVAEEQHLNQGKLILLEH
jgi:hypothetical protein